VDLYPAIDLRGGRCVRLYQGDFAQETVYDNDPVARARDFAAAGAPWIHVVDLDAARGQGSNRDVVIAIARAVDVPVQTGGGVRDASLLRLGIERIVLGSLAIRDPDAAAELIAAHPGHVAVGLDHRGGEVNVRGWEAGAGVDVVQAAQWPQFAGATALVITNIDVDATLAGPDLEGLAEAARTTEVPVIASGGVGTLDHLRSLHETGVAGVITGKALYEQRFTVAEAVAVCAGG
jgi:phosphoribosylformimino-5-aminoimidazole carboxamide ribotide isomerase